jgi:hypothetical protein
LIPFVDQKMTEPNDYKAKYTMATDVGYSKLTNLKQRELPWYGLWNVILTQHFPVVSAFLVSPQYPLWHLDDVDGEVVDDEAGDISLTLKNGVCNAILAGPFKEKGVIMLGSHPRRHYTRRPIICLTRITSR